MSDLSQSPHLRPAAPVSPDPEPHSSTFVTVIRPHTISTQAQVYSQPSNLTSGPSGFAQQQVGPSGNHVGHFGNVSSPSGNHVDHIGNVSSPSGNPVDLSGNVLSPSGDTVDPSGGSSSTFQTQVPLFESTRNDLEEAANEHADDDLLFSTAKSGDLDLTGNTSIQIEIETAESGPSTSLSSPVRPSTFVVTFDDDMAANLTLPLTDNDEAETEVAADGRSRDTDVSSDMTQDNAHVTVVSADQTLAATDETNKTDKNFQTSFSSSSSSTLNPSELSLSVDSVVKAHSDVSGSDAALSISQNEHPDHQDVPVVPPPLPSSAPASPTGRRRSPSASAAPPRSASSITLNKQRWLKGQGIDPSNIIEGKRLRKPKQK